MGQILVVGDIFSNSDYGYAYSEISPVSVCQSRRLVCFGNNMLTNNNALTVIATVALAVVLWLFHAGDHAQSLDGALVSTGNENPAVTLYFGADRWRDQSVWRGVIALVWGLQARSVRTMPPTGLSTNTNYYYAAAATNSEGNAWAKPSRSFTTLVPILPSHKRSNYGIYQGQTQGPHGSVAILYDRWRTQ